MKVNLDDPKVQEILDFIKGDVRFRGMTIKEAEELAWLIMFKWKGDFLNFLENSKNDVRMMIDGLPDGVKSKVEDFLRRF